MSDEELEHTRWIALGTGSKHTLVLLDEIARLRAARLRPETVEMMRAILADIGDWDAAIAVLRDLNRCYPPEEE